MSVSDLIGSSPKFRAVLEDVEMVAAADCAVLIQGETGTGKEEIAQASRGQPASAAPFCRGQLCSDTGPAAGERTVWVRTGRFHWRRSSQNRPVPSS